MRKGTNQLKSITNPLSPRIVDALHRHGALSYSAAFRAVGEPTPALYAILLRKLLRDRIITRRVITLGPPPATEYDLSPLGRGFAPLASALCSWLLENRNEILKNRDEVQVRRRQPHFETINTRVADVAQ